MKKALKFASALLAGVLALGLVACSSGDDSSDDDDSSSGKNNGGQTTVVTTGLTPVRSVAASSASTSVVLSWNDPSDTSNFGGVKITWGDSGSYTAKKGENTYTVTGLSAETEYTFTLTTLDASLAETTSKATVKITTPALIIEYKETAESLTVGSKVTVGDATYYVISNQLGTTSAKSSASASISARAAVATADESTDTASSATTESDEDEDTTAEITGTADLADTTSATTIDTGAESLNGVIEKFASDVYVRRFLKELGVTKYLQLYNGDARTSISKSGDGGSHLSDTFLIADAKGNKIAEFKQQFASYLFVKYYQTYVNPAVNCSTNEERGDWFYNTYNSKKKADELRENYEPSVFSVTTYENGVKKYNVIKAYNYDKNGEVATTKVNLNHVSYFRHPTSVNDTIVYPYKYLFYDYSEDDDKKYKDIRYNLNNPNGQEFYGLTNRKYNESNRTQITIQASGISLDDVKKSSRRNQIQIDFNQPETTKDGKTSSAKALYINARLGTDSTSTYGTDTISATNETSKRVEVTLNTLDSSTTNLLDQSVTVKVNGSAVTDESNKTKSFKLSEAISTYLSDYIRVSSKTTTVKNYTVPSEIYVRANFPSTYTQVAGHDFLNVVLVPVAVGTDSIKYVAVYDSTGADAFESAYNYEKATEESSYVPSFATLYKDNITKVADGTYTDTTTNPFTATTTTSE